MQPAGSPLWERKEEGKMVSGTRLRGRWTEWVHEGASLMKQEGKKTPTKNQALADLPKPSQLILTII